MSVRFSGTFLCEGSSDLPIATLVEGLFADVGVDITLAAPNLSLLGGVGSDLLSKLRAVLALLGHEPELVVIHRDGDGAGREKRLHEMRDAFSRTHMSSLLLPVVPIRMTEAWLLLDEAAIRRVAGNPGGRHPLHLPKAGDVERLADPKTRLQTCIVEASLARGRRRERLVARFNQNRRQLLGQLDVSGDLNHLESWSALTADVVTIASELRRAAER